MPELSRLSVPVASLVDQTGFVQLLTVEEPPSEDEPLEPLELPEDEPLEPPELLPEDEPLALPELPPGDEPLEPPELPPEDEPPFEPETLPLLEPEPLPSTPAAASPSLEFELRNPSATDVLPRCSAAGYPGGTEARGWTRSRRQRTDVGDGGTG
ncbi:MAG: hypothetical protein ACLP1X_14925, partial [Polyangiaceae bacterium]